MSFQLLNDAFQTVVKEEEKLKLLRGENGLKQMLMTLYFFTMLTKKNRFNSTFGMIL